VEITQPRWAIFENPDGFLNIDGGLAYEGVCADLEGKGYWVESFIIPASAVGAWHRRNRVWIIANLSCARRQQIAQSTHGDEAPNEGRTEKIDNELAGEAEISTPDIERSQGRQHQSQRGPEGRTAPAGDYQGLIERPWDMHWLQAVHNFCSFLDGVSLGSSHEKDRAKWIAALGDSIVPQVVIKIMEAIKEAD
jgi:DNA (cytosine-5)-methyltransferase 1